MIKSFKFLFSVLAMTIVVVGCTHRSPADESSPVAAPNNQPAFVETENEYSNVEDELKNLDATMNGVNGSDFDISTLSDGELGL